VQATLNAVAPTAVATPVRFAQISAGTDHTCALTSDGRAYCWGANRDGQLGTGTSVATITPQPVSTDARFASISAGSFHTCAVTLAGGAYCWGSNSGGQLGIAVSSSAHTTPMPVAGELRFRSIAAGALQTCGVAEDGRAICWGANSNGVLGTGDLESGPTPRPALTEARFSSLGVRGEHACGVATDGAGYCWGSNRFGELGNGVVVGRAVTPTFNPYIELQPTPVSGGLTFTAMDAGSRDFSCGLAPGGRLFCWGNNALGQLGTGRKRYPADTEYPVTTGVETMPALVRRP
jgi:alpha-tubulin suppressor-like RCC1 family protein